MEDGSSKLIVCLASHPPSHWKKRNACMVSNGYASINFDGESFMNNPQRRAVSSLHELICSVYEALTEYSKLSSPPGAPTPCWAKRCSGSGGGNVANRVLLFLSWLRGRRRSLTRTSSDKLVSTNWRSFFFRGSACLKVMGHLPIISIVDNTPTNRKVPCVIRDAT